MVSCFERAETYGIRSKGYSLDMSLVQKRKAEVVRTLVDGVSGLLKANGVEYVNGTARLSALGRVEVAWPGGGAKSFDGKKILIATGAHNTAPSVPGLALPGVIDSTGALSLAKVPKRMAIVGGGVIGIEFAGIYRAFGAEVSVVEFMPSILPANDKEFAKRLKTSLTKLGIRILENAKVEKVEKTQTGLRVTAVVKNAAEAVDCDCVLMATGRAPNTDGLGLAEMGILFDKRGIAVDDRYETNVKGIYAIGDVTGRMQLAHVASQEGIAAVEGMNGPTVAVNYDQIPSTVFTFPEFASVGFTEEQLKEKGLPYKVGKSGFTANGKAMTMNQAEGLIKVLSSVDLSCIYGVHILGPNASDILTEATAVMYGMFTVEEVSHIMHGHPTLSEVFMEAVNSLLGKAIHSEKKAHRPGGV
jgi:dihydrolipoamide dehydrogenase